MPLHYPCFYHISWYAWCHSSMNTYDGGYNPYGKIIQHYHYWGQSAIYEHKWKSWIICSQTQEERGQPLSSQIQASNGFNLFHNLSNNGCSKGCDTDNIWAIMLKTWIRWVQLQHTSLQSGKLPSYVLLMESRINPSWPITAPSTYFQSQSKW